MARVSLQNVSKIYPGDVRAVDDFSLEIEDGRFVVLVGPSGCGKSTTLRMVAGLEEISSGTVSIGGRVVNEVPPKDRDIAMVFQSYALYPHMTVYENMAFGLKLRKLAHEEIKKRVTEAAGVLGLADLLKRRPKQLSGGQRQRVALGRAIVRQPEVFLFDEPLSNLDAQMRVQMRVEISKLHRRLGQTMVYVTHDQTEAMTMGDVIVVMKDGVILQVAEPDELYNRPANLFVAGFIGTPPMNFFRGSLKAESENLVFDAKAFAVPLPHSWKERAGEYAGREVLLGLRPHDIYPGENSNPDVAKLLATVDVAESMGFETYVYLRAGDHNFVSRVIAQRRYEVGTELEWSLDLDKAHLFDPQTEKTVV